MAQTKLIWPVNHKATKCAHLVIINSLLATHGFITSSILSPECILPLAVSCLFSNNVQLSWAAEHLIANVYRLEEFTIDTTSALESLQVPMTKLQLIERRLCLQFERLAASRDKGCPCKELVDPPKYRPKDVLPVVRYMSYHLPGYLYQGTSAAQQLTYEHDEDEIHFKRLAELGKEWGGRLKKVGAAQSTTGSTNGDEITGDEITGDEITSATALTTEVQTTEVPTPTSVAEPIPEPEPTPSKAKLKKSKTKNRKRSKSKRKKKDKLKKSKSKVAPESKK